MKHRNTVTPDLVILRKFISYALCKGRENSYKCALLVFKHSFVRPNFVKLELKQEIDKWRSYNVSL
jgi:hypothetical protein